MNLTSLIRDALSRAGEAANSTSGDLPAGDGTSAPITTTAQLTTYINDAAADIARTCYRFDSGGTYSVPIGTSLIPFSALTYGDATASVLWAARTVMFNGVQIRRCTQTRLAIEFPNYETDITGTPAYWYDYGTRGIGIYPRPSVSQTLQVNGLAIPALLSGTQSPSWLPDDEHQLLSLYAAAMLAMKNAEDTSLGVRGPTLLAEYNSRKSLLLQRLYDADPGLAAAYYALPASASASQGQPSDGG